MTLISISEGTSVLGVFGIVMIALVLWSSRRETQTKDSFLVAGRDLSWKRGSLSIAVSWIWAPAIFIASMQTYTKGAAGAFWFIVPNILCFFVFAPVAVKLRRTMPMGYTLPQFILQRFDNDTRTHLAFLTIYFIYQIGAIIINALAGGTLLHILTGMNLQFAIISVSAIALAYSLISGLRASVLTDVVQMSMIIIVAFLLVPWTISEAGGLETLKAGLGGVSGEFTDILHPGVAYGFGIAITLGLICGPVGDQMFFQRTFAVRERDIVKTFVVGGLIFGIVPILLCSLGFIAAAPEVAATLNIEDPQMVGPLIIGHFLPKWGLLLFVFMAFAGLCSTLDSAYCALSSLGSVDIYQRYINPQADGRKLLWSARTFMLVIGLVGTGIALLQPKLLWVFLIYGTVASVGFFPTILSLYWKDLSKEGAFLAIALSLLLGLPLSIYASIVESSDFIVLSALLSLLLSLAICLLSGLFHWRTTAAGKDREAEPFSGAARPEPAFSTPKEIYAASSLLQSNSG